MPAVDVELTTSEIAYVSVVASTLRREAFASPLATRFEFIVRLLSLTWHNDF
jgi:hypothetical protein